MEIISAIHAAGYRATPQRQEFLSILSQKNSFDAETLKALFIERTHANLATFYRVLADFQSTGFVHSLQENGREYYSLCTEVQQGRMPTHFFELTHCHGCGNIGDRHLLVSSEGMLSSKQEIHV
ncbi:MAG: transcriptional repressor [Patescibacteria group bacterium]